MICKEMNRASVRILCLVVVFLAASISVFGLNKSKVIYSFPGGSHGAVPRGTLILDSAGNLYGVTESGGAWNYGAVFKLTPGSGGTWTEKVLYSFDGKNGAYPVGGLIFDGSGNLYGVTTGGQNCQYGCGTVYMLSPDGSGKWKQTVLHTFSSNDGASPNGDLALDGKGNLFGTTFAGGKKNYGVVFEVSPNGNSWKASVLHSFIGNGQDGSNPMAGLILDASGNLYGTTYKGGTYSLGTVFELTEQNGKWTETLLHIFGNDGGWPEGRLIFDATGNLYGTAYTGGMNFEGTVFELMPGKNGKWINKVLHNFGFYNYFKGESPASNLIFDAKGDLYGTTFVGGGQKGNGTVFELLPGKNGKWTENVLHIFNIKDGTSPTAGLVLDAVGNLYGTTPQGGNSGYGVVFEVMP